MSIHTHFDAHPPRIKNRALDQLDETIAAVRKGAEVLRPPQGWARSLRQALSMSLGHLPRASFAPR